MWRSQAASVRLCDGHAKAENEAVVTNEDKLDLS